MPSWNPPPSSASSYRRRDGRTAPSLPAGFNTVRDILDERIGTGRPVSVVGVVKDHRLPIATKGSDYKSSLTIADPSTSETDEGVVLNIFREQHDMPPVAGGDVVVVTLAKTQRFGGGLASLITNSSTDIHVYARARIPKPPRSAFVALKEPTRKIRKELKPNVHEYVSWLYSEIGELCLPDEAQLEARSAQSLNIKDKFSLLKDVKDGRFCDAVVQIVKEPYDMGERMTLWVSDYTENAGFFNMTWGGADDLAGERDGDPYGYTSKFTVGAAHSGAKWRGPFGKKSLQVTCWEPHAGAVRDHLKEGDWVRLRNLQVRYGRNSNNLEGFLREDRAFPDRVGVALLEMHDPELVDARLKEAIRRKKAYEKKKKGQLKEIHSKASGAAQGTKRKAEEPEPEGSEEPEDKLNSKNRRRQQRAEADQKQREDEERKLAPADLNPLVKCENHDRRLSAFADLFGRVPYPPTADEAERAWLPFNCAKFRVHARVVDFHPARLEDFACSRRVSEYDVLSDDGGGSSSSSDSEASNDGTLDRFAGKRVWEWRFALKLEDPAAAVAAAPEAKRAKKGRRGKSNGHPKGPDGPRRHVWVFVDNADAQLLTGQDATDLRADPDALAALRETMFTLWGDLEERKSLVEDRRRKKGAGAPDPAPPRPGDRPPLESSDGEDGGREPAREPGLSQTSNKPFTCCVKQYGVVAPTGDPEKMVAGPGKQYLRTWALFGTKICS